VLDAPSPVIYVVAIDQEVKRLVIPLQNHAMLSLSLEKKQQSIFQQPRIFSPESGVIFLAL